MDQRGYQSRPFHPVSQPNVQSYLGAFPQSSSQLRKANNISVKSRSCGCSHNRSISTSQVPPTNKQSKEQYGITYTVYQHCFLSRFGPAQAMKPKPNQQITTNPNHFPTNHQGNNIIGSYQQQHRPGKQALIALKTRQVEVVLHISQTVNMHAQRNCGHGHHHGRALRIKTQKPVHSQCMGGKPSAQRKRNSRTHDPNFIEQHITKRNAHLHTQDRHIHYHELNPSTSQARQQTSQINTLQGSIEHQRST